MLRTIKDFDPREFEYFIHDVMVAHNFKNVVWRTPGADGGRDIEAMYTRCNPFGEFVSEKWYVECKKYTSSVSWPVVYPKISYAHSGGADILCVASFPNPSPNCENEIAKWNISNNYPKITVLRPYALRFDTPLMAKIGVKFGIIENNQYSIPVELLKLSANFAEQANSAISGEMEGLKYLDAAAKVTSLSRMLVDCQNRASPVRGNYCAQYDGESWIEGDRDLDAPSEVVRAITSLVRSASRSSKVYIDLNDDEIRFYTDRVRVPLLYFEAPFREIALLANFELLLDENSVTIKRRGNVIF